MSLNFNGTTINQLLTKEVKKNFQIIENTYLTDKVFASSEHAKLFISDLIDNRKISETDDVFNMLQKEHYSDIESKLFLDIYYDDLDMFDEYYRDNNDGEPIYSFLSGIEETINNYMNEIVDAAYMRLTKKYVSKIKTLNQIVKLSHLKLVRTKI